jgi:hypothetical protein
MKSYDVYMDSFVNVLLPNFVDPETQEGAELLHRIATEKYLAKLHRDGEIHFTWERYEDGDQPAEQPTPCPSS